MQSLSDISGYHYDGSSPHAHHDYLAPAVIPVVTASVRRLNCNRVLDAGCGDGLFTKRLSDSGFSVVGIDASHMGIDLARARYPDLNLQQRSLYDDLALEFGTFGTVVSLEVVEHLYAPRIFAARIYALTKAGGTAIFSTPYHGYWKNLALALTGKMDRHFTALWDHGHIKFWSIETLTALLIEAGFRDIEFVRVGRIPQFAKSLIAVARKPGEA
jgi:2-polyprenyl-3-methyl-5-hydroxy-6-metoxy-1,4-benzoquinol methylase